MPIDSDTCDAVLHEFFRSETEMVFYAKACIAARMKGATELQLPKNRERADIVKLVGHDDLFEWWVYVREYFSAEEFYECIVDLGVQEAAHLERARYNIVRDIEESAQEAAHLERARYCRDQLEFLGVNTFEDLIERLGDDPNKQVHRVINAALGELYDLERVSAYMPEPDDREKLPRLAPRYWRAIANTSDSLRPQLIRITSSFLEPDPFLRNYDGHADRIWVRSVGTFQADPFKGRFDLARSVAPSFEPNLVGADFRCALLAIYILACIGESIESVVMLGDVQRNPDQDRLVREYAEHVLASWSGQ